MQLGGIRVRWRQAIVDTHRLDPRFVGESGEELGMRAVRRTKDVRATVEAEQSPLRAPLGRYEPGRRDTTERHAIHAHLLREVARIGAPLEVRGQPPEVPASRFVPVPSEVANDQLETEWPARVSSTPTEAPQNGRQPRNQHQPQCTKHGRVTTRHREGVNAPDGSRRGSGAAAPRSESPGLSRAALPRAVAGPAAPGNDDSRLPRRCPPPGAP